MEDGLREQSIAEICYCKECGKLFCASSNNKGGVHDDEQCVIVDSVMV